MEDYSFAELWDLIPEFEEKERVGNEIVKYKRNLPDPDISARDLDASVIEFFQTHLISHPYAAWELVDYIIDIRNQSKNRLLEEVVLNALETLIDLIIEHPDQEDKKAKLYCLLSNIYHVSEWCMNQVRDIIVPRLYDLRHNRRLLDEVLLLSLLSRSVLTLLTQFLDYERKQNAGKCTTKSLFLRTCYEKVHWIDILLEPVNDGTLQSLMSHNVCHHLRLFRLILKIGSVAKDDESWWSDFDAIDGSVIQPGSALDMCHKELNRQKIIFQFLKKQDHNGAFDVSSNLLLTQLLGVQVAFTKQNCEAIRKVLQSHHELSKQQHDNDSKMSRTELELFNEFMIIKLYLSIIQSNEITQEVIDDKLAFIRNLRKSINDGKVLFQLLQTVFTLVFLRFEHIRKTKRKRKTSEVQSGSLSNNNSHQTDVSDTTVLTLQTGFVCLKISLKAILNSLRLFLMGLDKTEVYKTFDKELRLKFNGMLKDIDSALWRLRIIDIEGAKKPKVTESVKEWISERETLSKSNAKLEINSDDEISGQPKRKVHKKKLKKRPKLATGSDENDENDEASDEPVEYQLDTDTSRTTEQSESRTQHSRSTEYQRKVRSIISKMLMSPESMLTACMLKGDKESVQKIIKVYNLQDSEATTEYNFITNFNETKAKLKENVEKFKELSDQQTVSMSSSIEIDEIKNAAEIGFAKAKFLNILEQFTTKNKLEVKNCDPKRLDKAVNDWPNLKIYQNDLLNIIPLIDFMISIPCPYELNCNIFNYIQRQWKIPATEDGCPRFLTNVMDILTIFKNNNIEKSIGDLLNDDIFTLKPTQLKKQLENRQNVIKLLSFNVAELDETSKLEEVSQKFEMFESDTTFLSRIAIYVKNTRQLLKFLSNESYGFDEIMRMDMDNVIRKIIFRQQHSPEQVENFAFNANINMAHSIAILSAFKFAAPNGSGDDKLLSLFHLHEIGADSVKPNLGEPLVGDLFTVFPKSNMDILYYLKRQASFMVAYIVKEIQVIDYKSLKYDEPNFVRRMIELKSVEELSSLFKGNKMVTALSSDHIDLNILLKELQMVYDVNEKLKILGNVSERQWSRHKQQFNELRDSYIEKLITNDFEESQEKFTQLMKIDSIRKFTELLLKCIGEVKSDCEAERLLRWSLHPKNASELEESQLNEVQAWMTKLQLYRKIVKLFEQTDPTITWAKIKTLADEKPAILVNYLLNINTSLGLCLEFLKVHPMQTRSDEITKMWIEALNNKSINDQHDLLFKVIDTFPVRVVLEFFDFALGFIRNLASMKRVISFLNANIKKVPPITRVRYQKFTISTKIFECLGDDDELWSMASRPLIIFEQLLMNSKIEILRTLVKEVRAALDSDLKCSSCATTSENMFQFGENLIYDFDAYHDDCLITNECVDLLLKLYAAKALDFQIVEVHSIPASTEVSSLDSSFGLFQMPKEIPKKEQWVSDSDTNHCMCCKREKFSLLTRRHHCRRCGRVVCSSCSQNRIKLLSVYNDLMVRVCLECYQQMDSAKKRLNEGFADKGRLADEPVEWKLTGDVSKDQMVRDEFNFEYSPNVGLCIAIIDLHTSNDELANFLLFHCHRLELLLRPIRGRVNPEVDVILVAKMLKCLAFAAMIRKSEGEGSMIIEHAEVLLKVSENGCESIAPLIPMEPISNVTIRGVINDLIKTENWYLALELSVKYDRTGKAGVFSAWGVSAIKSGQYQFAKEKIASALTTIDGSSTPANEEFLKMLNSNGPIDEKKFNFRRGARSAPLLHEVLESLESTASRQKKSEPLQSPFRSKMGPSKETSKNILNVMESLQKIAEGDYGSSLKKFSDNFDWQSELILNTPYYDESMFYLLNYGGNVEFLTFLMTNNLVQSTLRYVIAQRVPPELFITHVFVPIVKIGRLADLMALIKKMDVTLSMWKEYIMAACKYLQRKRASHCLYQMQILTGDLVRASISCIKFYLNGSKKYSELQEKAFHLVDAKAHLQAELENTELTKIDSQETDRTDNLTMKWDSKKINAQINVIALQIEVGKYLASCESQGLPTIDIMSKIFANKPSVRTLFGANAEQCQVAILLLVCGRSIQSGFGISFRVIQECSLDSTKIYTTCTKYLANNRERLMEVEQLVESIKTNSLDKSTVDPEAVKQCDELIAMAVEIAYGQRQAEAKSQIDQLIRLISSKKMKIKCYIHSNQLKTAYLQCAAINNFDEIRRIKKLAESSNQDTVRRLCEKKLNQQSSDGSQSSKSDINQL